MKNRKVNYTECSKCKDKIANRGFLKHFNSCKGINKNLRKLNDKQKKKIDVNLYTILLDNQYKCNKCEKILTKSGIKYHLWRSHTEDGKAFISNRTGSSWNKGKTKETDNRIINQGINISKSLKLISRKSLSDEHKRKLSINKISFLEKNPDKVPYLLSRKNGKSYPEEYFEKCFESLKISLKFHLRVGRFELDFYNEISKICIEIDGEQHYKNNILSIGDINRTIYLEKLGWKVIRIRWSIWVKLSKLEKIKILNAIKKIIDYRVSLKQESLAEN